MTQWSMSALLALICSASLTALALETYTPLPGSTPQVVHAGDILAPVRVRVTDDAGAPIANWPVSYPIDGNLLAIARDPACPIDNAGVCSVQTDVNGIAEMPTILASGLGATSFRFGGARIDVTVYTELGPSQLEVVGGDDQSIGVGGAFPLPLKVRVTRGGVPVVGETMRFNFDLPSLASAAFDVRPPGNSGALDGGDLFAEATTDGSGIATSPNVRSLSRTGAVTLIAGFWDRRGGAWLTATAHETVTSSPLDYRDMWWGGPQESGWGMSMGQRDDRLFPVVFAYDDAGNPTWWLSDPQSLTWTPREYLSGLKTTRSAPYFAYDASKFTVLDSHDVLQLFFASQLRAAFTFSRFVPLSNRMVLDTVVAPLDFSPDIPQPVRGISDIWWGGPGQNGWGMSIMEKGGNLFITWFTYDEAGEPTWFVMSQGAWASDGAWNAPVYRTHAAGWLVGYNPATVTQEVVGNSTLTFLPDGTASFRYTVEGHAGVLPLQRFDF